MIEAGTPNTLLRRGLTRQSLQIGMEVLVDGYQSKDGSLRANGRDLTLPNGQTLFLGSSGTGAPYDKEPRKKGSQGQSISSASDGSGAGSRTETLTGH
jgi:hypothetical protein